MPAKLRYHAAPATPLSLAVVLALTVAGLLTLSGAEAANKQPQCGDTITADTRLHSDLVDCPSNGIVIGADDVTLDLNGHTISGDGEAFGQCPGREFCDFGVLNIGHDGVSVKKGSVRDFFNAGVLIGRVRENRVIDVSSKGNGFFGFVVSESARSLIRDSSGSRNPAPDGDGLGIFASHDIRVVDNSFKHNAQPGIHVALGSNDNVIEGNLISDSGPGILIEKADRNRVRRNRFVGNSAGLIVAPGSHNVIARNHLSGDGDGIAIEKGRDNVVKRNLVVGASGDGIYLGLDAPPVGGLDNVVRRNEVRGSGDDGFDVRRKDNHSVLTRNLAVGSGDDGFDIESRSTRLARNRATRNGDLGIAVRRGAIDRGGNRAGGNGDRRQCVHVKCHGAPRR
ncbi:MAG: NosD domain-containing protein [Vicinamibacteria bacterium]